MGALMALLEKPQRQPLGGEGCFATERKRPLPYLPRGDRVVNVRLGCGDSAII